MKNFIIFILGCFAALLFGELVGEKFGVFGITNRYTERNSAPRQRENYARYYSNFYDGWHQGFRAGARSERNHAEWKEDLYEEEDEV